MSIVLCVIVHAHKTRLLASTMFKKDTISTKKNNNNTNSTNGSGKSNKKNEVSFVIVNRTKMSIIYRGWLLISFWAFFSLSRSLVSVSLRLDCIHTLKF